MPTRVVVYAEGAKELHGELELTRAPGSPLAEAEFGAAHVLVRRTIDFVASDPSRTVQFEEPLRLTPSLRRPRGSDLLDRKKLRQLLAWGPHRRPDLAIVLVDEDGDEARLSAVKSYLDADWTPPVAVGVAVREFESWLISDMQVVRQVLGITINEPSKREDMKPGEAKALLDRWLKESDRANEDRIVRARIAQGLRLEELSRNSRSFGRFQEDLSAALALIPR